MLRTAKLPKTFKAEVVKTAYYIINKSPSTTIEMKTPMEMWTDKPTNYSFLPIFRCPTYVMYNNQEKIKLDSKSKKCIFLGYIDGVKEYCLWDPITRKIIINKNVIFERKKKFYKVKKKIAH